MNTAQRFRGFTLVELLVVIAIISLISSIVFAALGNTRLKARDAALRAEVEQLRNLYVQEFADNGTFTNLEGAAGWYPGSQQCTSGFAGAYALQARAICINILANTGTACPSGNCLWARDANGVFGSAFDIMVYLPGESNTAGAPRWYCLSHRGGISVSPDINGIGCYSNP